MQVYRCPFSRSAARACATAIPLFLAAVEVACSRDVPTVPTTPAAIRVVMGDAQNAVAGSVLPIPLAVTVVDAANRPVPGVEVAWSTPDGGAITPSSGLTDAAGRATATWRLAEVPGLETAIATVGDLVAARFAASATAPSPHPPAPPQLISVPTFDGSGQMVHPDIARVPDGFGGSRERLAITPYPFGNPTFELPSVFAGDDDVDWLLPPGEPNPVVSLPGGVLSDPDILYDPDARELRLYYRSVSGGNVIFLVRSTDGVTWSAPVEVAHAPSHDIVSPTVVRLAANDWRMWSVNSGADGCTASATTVELRRSTDGVSWSAPVAVPLEQPGYSVWHIDVEFIPELQQFWALYAVKTAGNCATPAAYLATSTDGVNWTVYPSPVLDHGAIPEMADVVYRSSLLYDAGTDDVVFWYSGATLDGDRYVWRAAEQRRARGELFTSIASAPPVAASRPSRPLPPMTDWP